MVRARHINQNRSELRARASSHELYLRTMFLTSTPLVRKILSQDIEYGGESVLCTSPAAEGGKSPVSSCHWSEATSTSDGEMNRNLVQKLGTKLTPGWCYGEWLDTAEVSWACQYCGTVYCADAE